MPADRKLSDQRRRQSDRCEAGLRGSVVLVDDPIQHVTTADVAERPGSRGHCAGPCGHLESKTAVRPMLIVKSDVVAKDGFEMVATENERPVEALFTYGPYPPLRDRVRLRRTHRCLYHLDTFGSEHLVEAGGELRIAVRDEEPERPILLGEIPCEVAGNLGDQGAGRMIGDTEDVDYAALELDDEQHIELGELDGVHAEQVGGQDAARLGGEELLPPGSAPRCWSETLASKDPADRTCRDTDPEPAKLALDVNTPLAVVLPAEADDELDDLIAEWGTSRTSLGSPRFPLASRELPMPVSRVSGVTRKQRHRHRGSNPLSAARIARSVVR